VKEANLPIMKASHAAYVALAGGLALWIIATPAVADQVSREQDIVNLRLGQRILVEDGSCPAGQIKEVLGSQMKAEGVVRVSKCIARQGAKR
jgi:phosphosulfolactate phosphohydrolase-like enzyme